MINLVNFDITIVIKSIAGSAYKGQSQSGPKKQWIAEFPMAEISANPYPCPGQETIMNSDERENGDYLAHAGE